VNFAGAAEEEGEPELEEGQREPRVGPGGHVVEDHAQPGLTRSRAEAGQGFMTSKTRKRTNPATAVPQDQGKKAMATR